MKVALRDIIQYSILTLPSMNQNKLYTRLYYKEMAVVHKMYILRWMLRNNEHYIKVTGCDHITAVAVNINISFNFIILNYISTH